MNQPVRILGIAGSLRKGSYNRAALRAAQRLTPEGAQIEIFELDGIPLFNQDEEGIPAARVVELKERVRAADAILFATPEYNYSIPGVLKNAIDWGSRPHTANAWEGKPAAIMSASMGWLGGARAQYHLRQVLTALNMHPLNQPDVMLSTAQQRFDTNGILTDEGSIQQIKRQLEALVKWTRRLAD